MVQFQTQSVVVTDISPIVDLTEGQIKAERLFITAVVQTIPPNLDYFDKRWFVPRQFYGYVQLVYKNRIVSDHRLTFEQELLYENTREWPALIDLNSINAELRSGSDAPTDLGDETEIQNTLIRNPFDPWERPLDQLYFSLPQGVAIEVRIEWSTGLTVYDALDNPTTPDDQIPEISAVPPVPTDGTAVSPSGYCEANGYDPLALPLWVVSYDVVSLGSPGGTLGTRYATVASETAPNLTGVNSYIPESSFGNPIYATEIGSPVCSGTESPIIVPVTSVLFKFFIARIGTSEGTRGLRMFGTSDLNKTLGFDNYVVNSCGG